VRSANDRATAIRRVVAGSPSLSTDARQLSSRARDSQVRTVHEVEWSARAEIEGYRHVGYGLGRDVFVLGEV
jgi:hypothetical protein